MVIFFHDSWILPPLCGQAYYRSDFYYVCQGQGEPAQKGIVSIWMCIVIATTILFQSQCCIWYLHVFSHTRL